MFLLDSEPLLSLDGVLSSPSSPSLWGMEGGEGGFVWGSGAGRSLSISSLDNTVSRVGRR